ncbi:acetyl-CoA carboxylase biotin carboxyl carrier protein [Bradyrhizobium sp. LB7.1]
MARQPDDKAAAKFSSEDSALVRELALLLDETSLTEIEIERSGLRLRVARNVSVAATMPMQMAAAPAALQAAAAVAAPAAADLSKHPGAVTSPMVGTAYWAPEPGAKPFIEVGSKVRGRPDAADHRSHEDHEPDPLAARRHGDADRDRRRPAGRVRRAARHH